ncbi:hypothetical protein [Burkholderia cepacia]|uniref:hypothetical protein n=1 Tax=Burkholderia cepacia TaxID=292 RepID=UPI0012D8C1D1|nr:hypothetical protein [Burkholderia cepacia]
MTAPSTAPASDVPSAFSTFSVDSDSPPAITRPEYAEHADVDAAACTGLALHATLSAGVLAKAGAASISARTEIGMRTVFFIGGPSVFSYFSYSIALTILHAAEFEGALLVRLHVREQDWHQQKSAAGQPTGSAFLGTAPRRVHVRLLVLRPDSN